MSRNLIRAVVHIVIAVGCCGVSEASSSSIVVDGREVLCHNFADPMATKVPLVIALHGLGSSPDEMVNSTGLLGKARSSGIFLAVPEGRVTRRLDSFSIRSWNAGSCCHERTTNSIDVEFIAKVLGTLRKDNAAIDLDQVYLIGFSTGACLAHRLGFQLPESIDVDGTQHHVTIKGIAALAGKLAISDGELAPRNQPIPLIHFHGTKDGVVDFVGTGVSGGYSNLGRDDMLTIWKDRNNATVAQPTAPPIDRLPADGTSVQIERWDPAPGDDGAPVVLVTIENGGHTWPGHEPPDQYQKMEAAGVFSLGRYTKEIKAEDRIFSFFGI